ncbi:MAG: alpha/beta fold hydrolase [Candidatus Rokubacteria bacterium]|nr:alpha/beta fold hydrolase [Candidatus Rokubacteria bacterium]
MTREFVLVHGMSHGAWTWELLTPYLERRGHRVVTVELPGHGRRAHERARASMDAYAEAVAETMAAAGVTRAVLVGHSMGGAVIQRATELCGARLAHLVFLAAVVLPRGGSLLLSHLPPATRALFRGLAAAGGGVVQYPAGFEHARWFTDMPPGDPRVVAALARLTPQPFRPCADRLDLSRFWASRVPRTYIRCLRDAAVTPAAAAVYARRLGVAPIDMHTAHAPMLSAPADLADILLKLRD